MAGDLEGRVAALASAKRQAASATRPCVATPGGAHAVVAAPATRAFVQRRGEMSAEDAVWASVPYNYAARTRAQFGDRIAADILERLRFPIEPKPYVAQLAAALDHDAYERLGAVSAPTLVVHGTEDLGVRRRSTRRPSSLT
jgi:fermentation-respiration switch protein FrsA (DUF1100 family)